MVARWGLTNVGASPARIRDLIVEIAEIVRAVIPDTDGVDDAERKALAAVTEAVWVSELRTPIASPDDHAIVRPHCLTS
jgi:hypothetical protein